MTNTHCSHGVDKIVESIVEDLDNELDMFLLLGNSWHKVQNNTNNESNIEHLQSAHCPGALHSLVSFTHRKRVNLLRPMQRAVTAALATEYRQPGRDTQRVWNPTSADGRLLLPAAGGVPQ